MRRLPQTPHGDQFDARKDRGRCDACHTVEAFAPAGQFDHDRDASFSLKGAHEGVPCNQCHPTDLEEWQPEVADLPTTLGEVRKLPRQGVQMRRLVLFGLALLLRGPARRRSSAPARPTAS